MKLFFVLLILISFPVFATEYNPSLILCKKPHIDLNKMSEVLSSMKSNPVLSQINSKSIGHAFPENGATIKAKQLSQKIQKEIFGKEVIKLDFIADGLSANYVIENNNMRLVVGVGLIQHILSNSKYQDSESLLAFIIAHEISHAVQVISESPYKLSINGNIHGTLEDRALTKKIVIEEVRRRGFDSGDNIINSTIYTNMYLYSHQEVDAYALLILKKLGIALPSGKDFKLILEVMGILNSNQKISTVAKKSTVEAKYNQDLMKCFIKIRLEYIDQFFLDYKNI